MPSVNASYPIDASRSALTSSLRRVAFIMLSTNRRTMGLEARSSLVKTYDPDTWGCATRLQ